jgi:hypothetical protein
MKRSVRIAMGGPERLRTEKTDVSGGNVRLPPIGWDRVATQIESQAMLTV